VTLVDVGASIGDTAMLVRDRCPTMVDEIMCIEGDDMFAALLDANVATMPGVRAIRAMAGDGSPTVPSLVRTHAGSATPRGDDRSAASTLDELTSPLSHVDVVKIDTDGYDGHVLVGAGRLLEQHRPVVQFEWHPQLAAAANVDVRLPFETLTQAGYETFVWFDKYGKPAWTESNVDADRIVARASWCTTGATPSPDWHYDVIALVGDDRALASALMKTDPSASAA
jgi:FkbM family methyltransferase